MGLSPEYYNSCTDDVLNLYAEVEDRIISDIVHRIIKTGDITETAKWQIRQAQQMGLLYDDIIKDITKYTNKTDREIKKMFENAGVETVNNDNRLHIQAGKSPLDIRQSESMLQILNGVYENSLTDLKNLTGTTAITSQTAYIGACNSAFMMVSSGAFSYQQALRTVIQEISQKGATVSYPSGHVDRLDVAVRRSLLTGIGLASRQISEENSRLCDCDLMEISAHSGARPSHSAWQGQIVSLSGRKGYLSKSDIGYGTGAGFGGWNCRHDWYPFYEGISKRNYTQSNLDKLNAKDIEYNGKMYSEYEISQMLRKQERDIRALKREKVAYKTALSETDDKELKAVFQSALTYTNSAIRDKSTQIQDFCNETGYKRDRFREQVGGKTSVRHGDKIIPKDLTSSNNRGKMNNNKNIDFIGLSSVLENRSLQIYYILNRYTDKESKWSKKTYVLPPEKMLYCIGRKEWSCDISLREEADTKTIIHEHLHSRSCSHYTIQDYIKNKKTEEGAVELFAQQICIKNGLDYIDAYPEYVKSLRQLNHILNINSNEFEFAKEFFELEEPERYNWLKTKADIYLANNPNTDSKTKYKINKALSRLK